MLIIFQGEFQGVRVRFVSLREETEPNYQKQIDQKKERKKKVVGVVQDEM